MASVYVNGELVDASDAVVSVFDHGLLTGDGVFESVAVRNGRPFALQRHLQRLGRSASAIGLEIPDADELTQAARLVLAGFGSMTGKLRITVTGGPGPLGSARGGSAPTVVVAAEQVNSKPSLASIATAPWPRNEHGVMAGLKTISYAENVVALAFAATQGGTEALFLNIAGNVCEGTGSNIFVGVAGRLVTPPLSSGCLAGVTRGLVLENIEADERDIAALELNEASEAFLTSTTRGVQPIVSIDGRALVPCPGPLTRAASQIYCQLVDRGEP
ncbi:MAG: aminotransferase class IV [Acidimicrobiales bacterium]